MLDTAVEGESRLPQVVLSPPRACIMACGCTFSVTLTDVHTYTHEKQGVSRNEQTDDGSIDELTDIEHPGINPAMSIGRT